MDLLTISGATIFTPHKRVTGANLFVEAGKFSHIGAPQPDRNGERIDARGLYLAPGLLELQINGAFGLDFTSQPDCIWEVARELPRFGVTRFLPTIITSPLERVAQAQAVLRAGPPAGFRGAQPIGLHVEGPFLNPERKGAHPADFLRPPNLEAVTGWRPDTGIRMVTLAPELPGALEVIRTLAAQGVLLSAGHSMATLDQAQQAFAAGVRYGTHLFNAMPLIRQFEPGLVAALLADPACSFGLIADGIHVHPTLVDLVWKLSGPGRLNLVSDAMAALGQGPGHYMLGELEVIVDESSARLPSGVLAGSILSHTAALRNLMAFTGCSIEDALTCLTTTPARLLGLDGAYGQVAPGRPADFVLLTPDLEVVQTFVDGQRVYANENYSI